MPHVFTLLFFILVALGVLSLILNWADVKYTFNGQEKTILGAGILDWFSVLPAGFIDSIFVILFLFVLGGLVNLVIKTQALEALIGKIAGHFQTKYQEIPITIYQQSWLKYYFQVLKEWFAQTWIIIPLMLFFSFAGTTYGLAEESLAFYAIIIPLTLATGFDVWTGFLIVFVGAGSGVMGSTINPFSTLAAVGAAKDNGVEISVSDGAAWRWLGWIVFTLTSIIFVMVYAAKVKKNREKSALKDLFEVHERTFAVAAIGNNAPVLTKKRLVTAIIFLSLFVFMVFAMLNYDSMNSLKDTQPMNKFETKSFGNKDATSWFHNSKVTDNLNKSKYLGDGSEYSWIFGNWYLGALIAYFLIASIVIALINWKGERNYIEEMMNGAKAMMGVAFAVGIARAISVLLDVTNMKDYFVKELQEIIVNSKGNKKITIPLLSYILFIPLTFFIPSTSGLASVAFPVLGPAVNNVSPNLLSGTITAYSWAAGFANMFVPTYGVVIGALTLTKIPFNKFLKAIWKYLVLMFLLGFVLIILGGLTQEGIF